MNYRIVFKRYAILSSDELSSVVQVNVVGGKVEMLAGEGVDILGCGVRAEETSFGYFKVIAEVYFERV